MTFSMCITLFLFRISALCDKMKSQSSSSVVTKDLGSFSKVLTVQLPVKIGDVIIQNVAETGVDIVATANM